MIKLNNFINEGLNDCADSREISNEEMKQYIRDNGCSSDIVAEVLMFHNLNADKFIELYSSNSNEIKKSLTKNEIDDWDYSLNALVIAKLIERFVH